MEERRPKDAILQSFQSIRRFPPSQPIGDRSEKRHDGWVKATEKSGQITAFILEGQYIPVVQHRICEQNAKPQSGSMILPTYPGKIPQTSPNPTKKEIPSETVGEGSGVSSRGMWVRS